MSKPNDKATEGCAQPGRRRFLLRGGSTLAALAAGACAYEEERPLYYTDPSPKVTKAYAAYRPAPNGPQRCAVCVHYVDGGRCRIVEGYISPQGWSRYFEPRPPSLRG